MSDVFDNSVLPSPAEAWSPGEGVPIPGPQGPTGATGPAPNIDIGTVVGGPTANATITGTNPNYILNLVLPQGPQGNSGTPGGSSSLSIGTVTTLPVGSSATASITGTAPNLNLNLGLPTGATGAAAPPGVPAQIIVGTGAPNNTTGANGDSYVNLTTGDWYGPKSSGAWGPVVGNFKGIPDAPNDGKLYGRKNNAWVEIVLTP